MSCSTSCWTQQNTKICQSVLPLCFSFTTLHPPLLLCLTAFPLPDLNNVIFSIVEVAEVLLLFPFYLCFCLFFFSLLLMSLLEKEFRAAEVAGEAVSRCCSWYSHTFVGILTFHTFLFFSVALQTGVFTELYKTTATLFFTWLSKLSFNPRKYVWWMNPPNIHCVALLYSLYLVWIYPVPKITPVGYETSWKTQTWSN